MLNHSDTTHARYDINAPGYWDERSLETELSRVYDICVGCRLCWNLCPSFPALFDAMDAQGQRKRDAAQAAGKVGAAQARADYLDLPEGEHTAQASVESEFVGDVDQLTAKERWDVVDLCYQCKLCDPICPYTPDKEHHFALDFPRLMLRAQAVRTKKRGRIKAADKFLSNTDFTGWLGARFGWAINLANRIGIARWFMEKILGIARKRQLPAFARTPFKKWFDRYPLEQATGAKHKAALFVTCYTDANDPIVAQAAVKILEHNGVEVVVPPQQCCGAPYLSPGDFDGFKKQATPNVLEMSKWIDKGYTVVVTGPPTCSLTLRDDTVYLKDGKNSALAAMVDKVAANTKDISQFLMEMHKAGDLKTDFGQSLGTISYHLSCHLKAQRIGYKSRDLLKLVPDTQITVVDKCSGMDGGWGMKAEFFEASMAVADKLVKKIENSPAEHTCSDCTLAGLQIAQASDGRLQPDHPVVLLAQAYGLLENGKG